MIGAFNRAEQPNAAARAPDSHWLTQGRLRTFQRGESILQFGQPLDHWLAISSGVARISTRTGEGPAVAMGVLWLGDVFGATSPFSPDLAMHEVTALVELTALQIPAATVLSSAGGEATREVADLHRATAKRVQEQIARRLAGNGLQRLISVLGTLAQALRPVPDARALPARLLLPVSQGSLGDLAGLSRRQTWIYLQALHAFGWVSPTRSSIVLESPDVWLRVNAAPPLHGLASFSTPALCDAALKAIAESIVAPRTAMDPRLDSPEK